MTAIVVEIDKKSAFVSIRRPDSTEQSQINQKPHLIYWVRSRYGQVLEGMDADGLAKILGELGEIDKAAALEIVSEFDVIAELDLEPVTASPFHDENVKYATGYFARAMGPWLDLNAFTAKRTVADTLPVGSKI